MLEGFETETAPLSDEEKTLIGGFCSSLSKKKGPDNAVTCGQIIEAYKNRKIKIDGPRVRKIINHIRMKGLVPGLISSSKGYYVAVHPEDIKRYIESLTGRIDAISAIRAQSQHYLLTIGK